MLKIRTSLFKIMCTYCKYWQALDLLHVNNLQSLGLYVVITSRLLEERFSCSWLVSVSAPRQLVPRVNSASKHERVNVTTDELWRIGGITGLVIAVDLCVHCTDAVLTLGLISEAMWYTYEHKHHWCVLECKLIILYVHQEYAIFIGFSSWCCFYVNVSPCNVE